MTMDDGPMRDVSDPHDGPPGMLVRAINVSTNTYLNTETGLRYPYLYMEFYVEGAPIDPETGKVTTFAVLLHPAAVISLIHSGAEMLMTWQDIESTRMPDEDETFTVDDIVGTPQQASAAAHNAVPPHVFVQSILVRDLCAACGQDRNNYLHQGAQ